MFCSCRISTDKCLARSLCHSRATCYFLLHSNSKTTETTEPIFPIFTWCSAISDAINVHIHKTMVHFVSEHESKEWRRSILTSAKITQIELVTITTSLGLLWNICQFYNRNICIYQRWNIGKDWPSSCWDIRQYRPTSAESHHDFHLLPHFKSKTIEPIFTIFSNDGEQLVELLMRVSPRRYPIPFPNERAISAGGM